MLFELVAMSLFVFYAYMTRYELWPAFFWGVFKLFLNLIGFCLYLVVLAVAIRYLIGGGTSDFFPETFSLKALFPKALFTRPTQPTIELDSTKSQLESEIQKKRKQLEELNDAYSTLRKDYDELRILTRINPRGTYYDREEYLRLRGGSNSGLLGRAGA